MFTFKIAPLQEQFNAPSLNTQVCVCSTRIQIDPLSFLLEYNSLFFSFSHDFNCFFFFHSMKTRDRVKQHSSVMVTFTGKRSPVRRQTSRKQFEQPPSGFVMLRLNSFSFAGPRTCGLPLASLLPPPSPIGQVMHGSAAVTQCRVGDLVSFKSVCMCV